MSDERDEAAETAIKLLKDISPAIDDIETTFEAYKDLTFPDNLLEGIAEMLDTIYEPLVDISKTDFNNNEELTVAVTTMLNKIQTLMDKLRFERMTRSLES